MPEHSKSSDQSSPAMIVTPFQVASVREDINDSTYAELRLPEKSLAVLNEMFAEPAKFGSRVIRETLERLKDEIIDYGGCVCPREVVFREPVQGLPFDLTWKFRISSSLYDPEVITGAILSDAGFHLAGSPRIDESFFQKMTGAIPPRPFYNPSLSLSIAPGESASIAPEITGAFNVFLPFQESSLYQVPFLRSGTEGNSLLLCSKATSRIYSVPSEGASVRIRRAAEDGLPAMCTTFSLKMSEGDLNIRNIGDTEGWLTLSPRNDADRIDGWEKREFPASRKIRFVK